MNTNVTNCINAARLSLYHPNMKCTGAALHLAVRPACGLTHTPGCVVGFIVPQKTVGDAAKLTFPTFDREKGIAFTLGFDEVSQFLEVFRGETESIHDEKGLYQRLADGESNIVKLRHLIDPKPGYVLEVWRQGKEGEERNALFVLTPSEALGLSLALEQSMRLIAFGTEVEAATILLKQAEAAKAAAMAETTPETK